MRRKALLAMRWQNTLIKKHLKQQTRRPVSDYYSDDLLEAVDDYVSFVSRRDRSCPEGSALIRSSPSGTEGGRFRLRAGLLWHGGYGDRDGQAGTHH